MAYECPAGNHDGLNNQKGRLLGWLLGGMSCFFCWRNLSVLLCAESAKPQRGARTRHACRVCRLGTKLLVASWKVRLGETTCLGSLEV